MTNEYKALTQLYTPCIIEAIKKEFAVDDIKALEMFYNSNLYKKYMDEESKIWHFSSFAIANLLKQEIETGAIEYPIEG